MILSVIHREDCSSTSEQLMIYNNNNNRKVYQLNEKDRRS